MSTQQDIYAAGFENHPPMLNKENYVLWSSRLLRYAKIRPNRKLIHNSIINGPYVRRMIPEPGDPNREVPVNETFHVQTDDELTKKELKQIEADDQAIQTILLGLPEDIYVAVDSCETAQEICVPGNVNQNPNENGNLLAARAEGNATGHNGNQIRYYNCRGVGHFARNCTVRPRRTDVAYHQTQLLTDNGMRFMLAPRSAKAMHSSIPEKSHEMRNLSGSPIFSGNFLRRTTEKCSFNGVLASSNNLSLRHRVLCHLGLKFYYFRKKRRVIVLLERVLEPEDEASQLAVEESGVDEPELGNLGLDKPVLDKPAPAAYTFWVWPTVAGQSLTFMRFLLISAISAFSATIFESEEEVIEQDDSLRRAEVS
nr:hypothetical protein [Tanacetum cinerariifolium]